MTAEHNFGSLGADYQLSLMKVILTDKKFGSIILEILDSHYFDAGSFRYVVQIMSDYFKEYNQVPSYDSVILEINKENKNDTSSKMHLDTINLVKNADVENAEQIKDTALDFCRQQVMKRELKVVQSIIDRGDFGAYPQIEDIITKALLVGTLTSDARDIFDNIKETIRPNSRRPIPTGIGRVDSILKGGLGKCELGVLLAPTGVGKAQPVSELILTPTGWEKIGNIKIGDNVIGSNGQIQHILGVYPQGVRPIYNIKFTDKTSVMCDENHLWCVNTRNMREFKTRIHGKSVYKPKDEYVVIKTSDMMKTTSKRGYSNYRLPTIQPVEFNKKNVLIDPYILGLLIGDGYLPEKDNATLSTKDDDIINVISESTYSTSYGNYNRDNKTIKVIRFKKEFNKPLLEYELLGKKSNNKFIPKDYLYNSINVRIKLLQGLMDSDGYVSKRGISQYTTCSKQLSMDVRELVLSLGGTVSVNEKSPIYKYKGKKKYGQLSYTITISFANDIVPFRLKRKITRYHKRTKYKEQKFIKSIEFSHNEEAVCVKVSNLDELYVTSDYVLTHNTTLLTMFGNAGFMDNANVLQIIFEDNVESVMKKHFTIWTSIHPDDLHMEEEEVIKIATDKRSKSKGTLKILKLPSDSVTISELKSNIRKLKSEGFNPDLILLDYVDCLVPEKAPPGEEWKGEGNIMRHLEAMTTEFDVAMWAATQGNRESIQTELVTTNLMGGSIKKAQIGHIVISVGKTLEQKENKLATMAILKSRIGPDGIVFSNCIFDNEYLIFDADNQDTMFGAEEKEEERKRNRGPEALREARRKQREGVNDIKITLDFDDEKSERVNYEIDNLSNEQPKDENNENQDRVVKPEKIVTTEKTLGEAKADKRKLDADKRAENLRKKARKAKENNNQ